MRYWVFGKWKWKKRGFIQDKEWEHYSQEEETNMKWIVLVKGKGAQLFVMDCRFKKPSRWSILLHPLPTIPGQVRGRCASWGLLDRSAWRYNKLNSYNSTKDSLLSTQTILRDLRIKTSESGWIRENKGGGKGEEQRQVLRVQPGAHGGSPGAIRLQAHSL